MMFFVIYVGLFGTIVVNEGLVVSDIPLYSNYPSTNGRLEWLSFIIWTIVLVYQSALMLICARESLSYTTALKNNSILSVIICVLMGVSLHIFYLNYALVLKIISSTPFNISLISFILVLVLLLIICSIRRRNHAIINKKNC